MRFSNMEVTTTSKPDSTMRLQYPLVVEWERVNPRYRPRLFVQRIFWTLFTLLLLAGGILVLPITLSYEHLTVVILITSGACLSVLIAVLIVTAFDYRYRGYAIRESDILFKKGVIFRVECVVPFSRIQHIREDCGVIDRMFGLLSIHFCTAGGQNTQGKRIDGCSNAVASKIRQYTMDRMVSILASQFSQKEEVTDHHVQDED